MSERILSLVSAIYDAVSDDDVYAGLAQRLAAETGATHAWLPLMGADGSFLGAPMHNFPLDEVLVPYGEYYARIDPWRIAGDVLPACRAWRLDGIVPAERMKQSEIYNDLIVPTTGGLTHCMFTPLGSADTGRSFLSLMRTPAAGGFDDESEALITYLAPHLHQMLALRERLQASGRRALYAEDALDAVAFGVMRCHGDGRIRYANRVARDMLHANDGLRTNPNLECSSRTANAALQSRLRAVARGVVAEGALLVQRPSGAPAYRVVVLPFATAQRMSDDEVLLFIHDPALQDPGLMRRVAELFALSPAEADLAVGLAQGETLQEIADRRQVRISTVRSQFQSVLAKTGTRRQSELIRVVLALGHGAA